MLFEPPKQSDDVSLTIDKHNRFKYVVVNNKRLYGEAAERYIEFCRTMELSPPIRIELSSSFSRDDRLVSYYTQPTTSTIQDLKSAKHVMFSGKQLLIFSGRKPVTLTSTQVQQLRGVKKVTESVLRYFKLSDSVRNAVLRYPHRMRKAFLLSRVFKSDVIAWTSGMVGNVKNIIDFIANYYKRHSDERGHFANISVAFIETGAQVRTVFCLARATQFLYYAGVISTAEVSVPVLITSNIFAHVLTSRYWDHSLEQAYKLYKSFSATMLPPQSHVPTDFALLQHQPSDITHLSSNIDSVCNEQMRSFSFLSSDGRLDPAQEYRIQTFLNWVSLSLNGAAQLSESDSGCIKTHDDRAPTFARISYYAKPKSSNYSNSGNTNSNINANQPSPLHSTGVPQISFSVKSNTAITRSSGAETLEKIIDYLKNNVTLTGKVGAYGGTAEGIRTYFEIKLSLAVDGVFECVVIGSGIILCGYGIYKGAEALYKHWYKEQIQLSKLSAAERNIWDLQKAITEYNKTLNTKSCKHVLSNVKGNLMRCYDRASKTNKDLNGFHGLMRFALNNNHPIDTADLKKLTRQFDMHVSDVYAHLAKCAEQGDYPGIAKANDSLRLLGVNDLRLNIPSAIHKLNETNLLPAFDLIYEVAGNSSADFTPEFVSKIVETICSEEATAVPELTDHASSTDSKSNALAQYIQTKFCMSNSRFKDEIIRLLSSSGNKNLSSAVCFELLANQKNKEGVRLAESLLNRRDVQNDPVCKNGLKFELIKQDNAEIDTKNAEFEIISSELRDYISGSSTVEDGKVNALALQIAVDTARTNHIDFIGDINKSISCIEPSKVSDPSYSQKLFEIYIWLAHEQIGIVDKTNGSSTDITSLLARAMTLAESDIGKAILCHSLESDYYVKSGNYKKAITSIEKIKNVLAHTDSIDNKIALSGNVTVDQLDNKIIQIKMIAEHNTILGAIESYDLNSLYECLERYSVLERDFNKVDASDANKVDDNSNTLLPNSHDLGVSAISMYASKSFEAYASILNNGSSTSSDYDSAINHAKKYSECVDKINKLTDGKGFPEGSQHSSLSGSEAIATAYMAKHSNTASYIQCAIGLVFRHLSAGGRNKNTRVNNFVGGYSLASSVFLPSLGKTNFLAIGCALGDAKGNNDVLHLRALYSKKWRKAVLPDWSSSNVERLKKKVSAMQERGDHTSLNELRKHCSLRKAENVSRIAVTAIDLLAPQSETLGKVRCAATTIGDVAVVTKTLRKFIRDKTSVAGRVSFTLSSLISLASTANSFVSEGGDAQENYNDLVAGKVILGGVRAVENACVFNPTDSAFLLYDVYQACANDAHVEELFYNIRSNIMYHLSKKNFARVQQSMDRLRQYLNKLYNGVSCNNKDFSFVNEARELLFYLDVLTLHQEEKFIDVLRMTQIDMASHVYQPRNIPIGSNSDIAIFRLHSVLKSGETMTLTFYKSFCSDLDELYSQVRPNLSKGEEDKFKSTILSLDNQARCMLAKELYDKIKHDDISFDGFRGIYTKICGSLAKTRFNLLAKSTDNYIKIILAVALTHFKLHFSALVILNSITQAEHLQNKFSLIKNNLLNLPKLLKLLEEDKFKDDRENIFKLVEFANRKCHEISQKNANEKSESTSNDKKTNTNQASASTSNHVLSTDDKDKITSNNWWSICRGILTARTLYDGPCSNNPRFIMQLMPADGDCAFHTIGITRERAVQLLLAAVDKENVRNVVAKEMLRNFYLPKCSDSTTNQKYLPNLHQDITDLPEVQHAAKVLFFVNKYFSKNSVIADNVQKLIYTSLITQQAYTLYIKNTVAKAGEFLEYDSQDNSPSCILDALAMLCEYNLTIWQRENVNDVRPRVRNSTYLKPVHRYTHDDGRRTYPHVHMFHTNAENLRSTRNLNHFNRLEEAMDEQDAAIVFRAAV